MNPSEATAAKIVVGGTGNIVLASARSNKLPLERTGPELALGVAEAHEPCLFGQLQDLHEQPRQRRQMPLSKIGDGGEVGLRAASPGGITLDVSGSYDGIGIRSYSAITGAAAVRMPLN